MKQIAKTLVAIMCVVLCQGCNKNDVEIDLSQTFIDGNKWTYHCWIQPTQEEYTMIAEVQGDTIMGGLVYKKVRHYVNDYEGDFPIKLEYYEYFREEGEKIYNVIQYSGSPWEDKLAYTFGLKINDTTTHCKGYGYTATVQDLYWKETQDGVKRKHIVFDNSEIWVEGVGSLEYGLLPYNGPGYYYGGVWHRLKKFESQGKVVYVSASERPAHPSSM